MYITSKIPVNRVPERWNIFRLSHHSKITILLFFHHTSTVSMFIFHSFHHISTLTPILGFSISFDLFSIFQNFFVFFKVSRRFQNFTQYITIFRLSLHISTFFNFFTIFRFYTIFHRTCTFSPYFDFSPFSVRVHHFLDSFINFQHFWWQFIELFKFFNLFLKHSMPT